MITSFILGILSSIIATYIFLHINRIDLNFLLPRGVSFLKADRKKYIIDIANNLVKNNKKLFFKGLTGFDLFSTGEIKYVLESQKFDGYEKLIFIFNQPDSEAFDNENKIGYPKERLVSLQKIIIDNLNHNIFNNLKNNDLKGVFFFNENRNFVNLLVTILR